MYYNLRTNYVCVSLIEQQKYVFEKSANVWIGFCHINDTVRSDIHGRIKGELLVLCKVCAQFLRYERQIPSDNDIQRYNVLRSGYFNKQ